MNINSVYCNCVQTQKTAFGANIIDKLSEESKAAWQDTSASLDRGLRADIAYDKLKGYLIVVKDGRERFVADVIKAGKPIGKTENFDLKNGAKIVESLTDWNIHDLVARAETFAVGDSIVSKVKTQQGFLKKLLNMIKR